VPAVAPSAVPDEALILEAQAAALRSLSPGGHGFSSSSRGMGR
jgi:hypothetical protein